MAHQGHDAVGGGLTFENAPQGSRVTRKGDLGDHVYRGGEVEGADEDLGGLNRSHEGAGEDTIEPGKVLEERARLGVHASTAVRGQTSTLVALCTRGLRLFMSDQNPPHHRLPIAPRSTWGLLLLAALGCYRHGDAHLLFGGSAPGEVTVKTFRGELEGVDRWGRAKLRFERGAGGTRIHLRLVTRTATLSAELTRGPRGTPRTARTHIDFAGVRRGLTAERSARGLSLASEGAVTHSPRPVPWGPESRIDAGHPLLWGPLLDAATNTGTVSLRVLRLDPRIASGLEVDHFVVEPRGRDSWGRRMLVETRRGPVALWLDGFGDVVRCRWRRRNGHREEWEITDSE